MNGKAVRERRKAVRCGALDRGAVYLGTFLHRIVKPAAISVACGALLVFNQYAWATAPIQQTTNPTAFSTFYSVVDMTTGPTSDLGTGSIIDSDIVNQGGQQIGYFCVLTANHVIAGGASGIGFGYFGDGTNTANSFSNTYNYTNVVSGGSTGKEDLSVAIVRYGVVDPFFISVQDLKLWTPPANLTLANMPSPFTEVGYGDTGTPHVTAGVQDGFTPQSSSGIQRFDNANPASVNANAAHGIYTYTDIKWNPGPVSPGNPNLGTGSSFGGDSGGPYFMSDATAFKVNGLTDVFGNAVGQQNINAFSNTIFAVHTFGNNNNPQLFADNIQSGGNLLTAADITWINNACATVPEPSTVVLALCGIAALAIIRRSAA
jgi:hypothetical protein